MSDSQDAPKADTWVSRLRTDRNTQILTAAVTVLLVGLIVSVTFNVLGAASASNDDATITDQQGQIKTLSDKVSSLEDDVRIYRPAYDKSKSLDRLAVDLSNREAAVQKRETDADATSKKLDEREAAVQAREAAASANANASDWWVGKVRDCLARSGQSRIATITESSLIGRDSTCYTG